MKFKLDENLPELVREALRELGHDVHTVADEGLSGAADDAVLGACVAEGRVLITPPTNGRPGHRGVDPACLHIRLRNTNL